MTSQKLKWKEKVGYSMGDVAANMVFQMMMIYQLKFYTDIFGLDGAVAGSILLIAPLLSAFADPLVGVLADRTHTRWGKYRPWLLWSAVPFCACYILAFNNPGLQDKTQLTVYATVSYVLLLCMYSFSNTPYSSLSGVMTSSIRERTSVNTIRFIASSMAQFGVQGFTLLLVDRLGVGNAAHGWSMTVLLYALLALVLLLVCFFSTRERISPPPHQQTSIHEDVSQTLGDVSWRVMFVLCFSIYVALAMSGASMNFYFQSYLDPEALYLFLHRLGLADRAGQAYTVGFSLFNVVNASVQFLGVLLLSAYLSNRFGKKTVYIVGLLLTVVFQLMFYLPGTHDVLSVYVLCLLRSLAYAPTIPLLWAMVGDVADRMELIHGRRATGFCFSGIMFALKVGLGFGGALTGILLSCFGYAAGGAVTHDPMLMQGIRIISSLVPALLFAIGLMSLRFYPITKQYNEAMQQELSRRRSGAETTVEA